MSNQKEFKPYVPADKITPEFTVTSIVMGIILAVVFGAANAYLGLRVGMTVSASIPAAVLAMGCDPCDYAEKLHSGEQHCTDDRICRRVSGCRSNLYPACPVPVGKRG